MSERTYFYYDEIGDPDIAAWVDSLPLRKRSAHFRLAIRYYLAQKDFINQMRQAIRAELADMAFVAPQASDTSPTEEDPEITDDIDALALTWSDELGE